MYVTKMLKALQAKQPTKFKLAKLNSLVHFEERDPLNF